MQKFIMAMQKAVITFSLIIIYFAGFGLTLIFILLFKRELIYAKSGNGAGWAEAEGYEADIKDAAFQS